MTLARYLALATGLGLSIKEAMLAEIGTIYGIHEVRYPPKEG